MALFLWDGDDTLWMNLVDYYDAQLQFLQWIREVHKEYIPPINVVLQVLNKIDSDKVAAMGFSQDRFPKSMLEAYAQLCSHLPGYHPDNLTRAYEIGQSAFDPVTWAERGLVEGAEETLEYLAQKGHRQALLTKGDPFVQIAKLHALQIRRWFGEELELLKGNEQGIYDGSARIFITPSKSPGIIRYVAGLEQQVYVVGNSVRSDILPALEAGCNGIWIPAENWDFEREHPDMPKKDITLKKINDLMYRF